MNLRLAVLILLLVPLVACGGKSEDQPKNELTLTNPPASRSTCQPKTDEADAEFTRRCKPSDSIPSPNTVQSQDLLDKLNAIAPGLDTEPGQTVEDARNTCDSILGGSQTLVSDTQTRFKGDGVRSLTEDQAQEIVGAVKAEEWCERPQ